MEASKNKIVGKKIKDIRITKGMKVSALFDEMSDMGGFSGQHMARGKEILGEMIANKDSFNFLSFPADIVSTGLR